MDVLLAKRLQQQRTPRLFRRALRAAEEFDFDVDNVELAQRYVKACKDLQGVFAALDERFLPLDASGPGRIRAFLYEEAADAAAASNSPLSPPRRSQDSLPSSPPETPDTFLSAGSASAGCRGDFPESSSGQAGTSSLGRKDASIPTNLEAEFLRMESSDASQPSWSPGRVAGSDIASDASLERTASSSSSIPSLSSESSSRGSEESADFDGESEGSSKRADIFGSPVSATVNGEHTSLSGIDAPSFVTARSALHCRARSRAGAAPFEAESDSLESPAAAAMTGNRLQQSAAFVRALHTALPSSGEESPAPGSKPEKTSKQPSKGPERTPLEDLSESELSPFLSTAKPKCKRETLVVSDDDDGASVLSSGGASSLSHCRVPPHESVGRPAGKAKSSSTPVALPKPVELSSDSDIGLMVPKRRTRQGVRASHVVESSSEDEASSHSPASQDVFTISGKQDVPEADNSAMQPGTVANNVAAFKRIRQSLTSATFREFNEAVFEGQLSADMSIKWSKTLQTTAGRTYPITLRRGSAELPEHVSRIELSDKVCDCEERLRSTLMHEMCHAASWTIDRCKGPPHGPNFQKWGAKAMRCYPDLEVTRCHVYDVYCPFRWQCTDVRCKRLVERHSNSIDVARMRCSCGGSLVFLGRFRRDGTPAKPRQPSQFSLFVKDNFASTKKEQLPGTPHANVMKALAEKWKQQKAGSASESESRLPMRDLNAAFEGESADGQAIGGMHALSVDSYDPELASTHK